MIQLLDVNKANGPDLISNRMLKEAGYSIVPFLYRLFRLSLDTSIFPSQWKKADVIPIFKKGNPSLPNNYRQISLLSVVGKILERIIFKYVYNYLHDHSLITMRQSGFKPGDSAVNQLSYMYHAFCKALDEKRDVRDVFCDISKAFDRVWHEGLMYKLCKMGIKGTLLKWFKNYLSNRQQRVVINGENSQWGFVKAGVP